MLTSALCVRITLCVALIMQTMTLCAHELYYVYNHIMCIKDDIMCRFCKSH